MRNARPDGTRSKATQVGSARAESEQQGPLYSSITNMILTPTSFSNMIWGANEDEMNIAIGADHGGFPLKQLIVDQVTALGHTVVDCGAKSLDPADDYPDCAEAVGLAIQRGVAERGVLICGSGVGAAIAACKMRGIRATVCADTYSAHQGVEHDNMNVLALGARVIRPELAQGLVRAYVGATFSGGERHVRRLSKVQRIDERQR